MQYTEGNYLGENKNSFGKQQLHFAYYFNFKLK